MAKKDKKDKKKTKTKSPDVKEGPAKMNLHDTLAKAREYVGEGIKTGSIVSLRKAEALIAEAIQGQSAFAPTVDPNDVGDGDEGDDEVQVVE